jgi:D-alanyl-D-alanine carboxypeptidase
MRYLAILAAVLVLAGCMSRLPPTPAPEASVAAASAPAAMVSSFVPALFAPPREVEERAHAAIVVDVDTGEVLFEEDAEGLRYPASLTKMMTLYLLFEEIAAGRLTLSDRLSVSETAAKQPPSRIGLKEGETIRVEDAARAMAVKSGNDVAVVIAESLAGSEDAFAARMTRTARALGMRDTVFVNASGLPDTGQISTARDMAILARALKVRHPRFARYFSEKEFRYNGRRFETTNKLLGKVAGVDGLKTGYIRLSGFNLAASARRGGRSIIVVVMGGKTGRSRDAEVTRLIDTHL